MPVLNQKGCIAISRANLGEGEARKVIGLQSVVPREQN